MIRKINVMNATKYYRFVIASKRTNIWMTDAFITRSLAFAKGLCNALCQLKYCQLLYNSIKIPF